MSLDVKTNSKGPLIRAGDLELERWLELILRSDEVNLFPSNCFPTDAMRDAYLTTVTSRSDSAVRNLLRRLLIRGESYGIDDINRKWLIHLGETDPEQFESLLSLSEYWRELLMGHPWQRNTWILNLLPHWPKDALRALDAYLLAHGQEMTDWMLGGHCDAAAIIRAKYIELPTDRELFLEIGPLKFECLVATLYKAMGYEVNLTPRSYDGGIDVVAHRRIPGRRRKLLIQCRCSQKVIGVEVVRSLIGVVATNRATQGILVTTAKCSSAGRSLANADATVDLIDDIVLSHLLNEHLGPTWRLRLEHHTNEAFHARLQFPS